MILNSLASKLFSLENRVAVITGGAGLLGLKHAEIVAAAGGIPLLVDLDGEKADRAAHDLEQRFGSPAKGLKGDVTSLDSVLALAQTIRKEFGRIDILINNAANNPSVEKKSGFSRVENFPLEQWDADVDVGLKGAFLCTQVFGGHMVREGGGVVVNISSEYGVNAPDQRLYRVEGIPEDQQPVKPVTYTIVKSGLIGMTRYFAAYWGAKGVRVNAISIAGVQNGQPEEFVRRYVAGVPLGRMAQPDEYQGSILYLCSDASRFLTGANLIVDGGKSCW
jgi:NAD(P)-dependent dehydrogenase (short-subunit alcohol dehydrogenase family)